MIFTFKPEKIREDFPVLNDKIIYLDSACMSLKPMQVIEKMNEYYLEYPACAGRSVHKFGRRLEEEISKARHEVAKLINCKDKEIIFTKNATESINLIANTFDLDKGDEVIITDKEHSSNIIPWLKLQKEDGIKVVICESNKDNTFSLDNFKKCFSGKTRLVSIVHISNLDGVVNPIEEIVSISHKKGVKVLIDACQSIPHKEIDVTKLDCDFLAFSGHKMLGPTGTGVLYGKFKELEKLKQFIVGGETVIDATFEGYKEEEIPAKFEAGLQNYSGIIGLGEACRYLKRIRFSKIKKHEEKLNMIVSEGLAGIKEIEIIGPLDASLRSGIYNFNITGMGAHEVAKILDSGYGIMVRSGAHCVHEWFNKHNIKNSVRASFYLYNTEKEARRFVDAVKEIAQLR